MSGDITPETCPAREMHGVVHRYCLVKGCGWVEPKPPAAHDDRRERVIAALTESLEWTWRGRTGDDPTVPTVREVLEPVADAVLAALDGVQP